MCGAEEARNGDWKGSVLAKVVDVGIEGNGQSLLESCCSGGRWPRAGVLHGGGGCQWATNRGLVCWRIGVGQGAVVGDSDCSCANGCRGG